MPENCDVSKVVMDLVVAAQYIVLLAGVLLLAKLFACDLYKPYRAFCCFLIADLAGSFLWLLNRIFPVLDNRMIWLVDRVVVWCLTFWTVLALLNAVLKNYPGILRLSRRVLHITFALIVIVSVISAIPEYASASSVLEQGKIYRALAASFVIERIVFSISLICLLSVLGFLVWFPVEVPRNLAVFCVGFVVYFFVAISVLIANNYQSSGLVRFVNITANSVEAACLAYWFVSISKSGEVVQSHLGHARSRPDSRRLMAQLETLNEALVRSSRR